MTFRQNARAFPSAFRAGRSSGATWDTGGPRLPIGFWGSTETPDVFAASGTLTLPAVTGTLAATELQDNFAASGAVAASGGGSTIQPSGLLLLMMKAA